MVTTVNKPSGTLITIPLNDILADENFNCRGHIAPIDVVSLAKDIQERGLIQPVTVAPLPEGHESGKKYRLIAGYRRYTAHKVISKPDIDSIVREDMADEAAARFFNLAENLQRTDLTIVQEAKALVRLKEVGVGEVEAAERLNVSRGWIQIRYMLLALPVEVQAEVEAGYITQTQIRELYTIHKKYSEEELFAAVRKLKDAKITGKKDVTVNPNLTKPTAKRHRKRGEIQQMMDHIQVNIGNGLHTRCLAWASGEISDSDLFDSIAEFADDNCINYIKPETVDDIEKSD